MWQVLDQLSHLPSPFSSLLNTQCLFIVEQLASPLTGGFIYIKHKHQVKGAETFVIASWVPSPWAKKNPIHLGRAQSAGELFRVVEISISPWGKSDNGY